MTPLFQTPALLLLAVGTLLGLVAAVILVTQVDNLWLAVGLIGLAMAGAQPHEPRMDEDRTTWPG